MSNLIFFICGGIIAIFTYLVEGKNKKIIGNIIVVIFCVSGILGFYFDKEIIKADLCNNIGFFCQNKYEKNGDLHIKKARDYVSNDEYDLALKELDKISEKYSKIKSVNNLRTEIKEKQIEFFIKKINLLKKEKKYLEIIDFIDSLTDEQKLHNKIIQAKEDVINLYTNFCIKESEKILKSKGLDEAINYLNNVNDIIRNNNKILNQINKFENLKPIPLSSLEPFYLEESQYDTPYYKKDSNRDNEGNIRKDILGGTWKGTYVIDKKYK